MTFQDLTNKHSLNTSVILWHELLNRELASIRHELHGDLAQVLFALRLELTLLQLQQQTNQTLLAKTDSLLSKTEHCIQLVAKLTNNLLIANFNQGLKSALEDLIHYFSWHCKLACRLQFADNCNVFEKYQSILIYHVVYEALTNSLKHAQANSTTISAKKIDSGHIQINISDNGCGFAINQLDNKNLDGKLGLKLIQEFCLALNAKLIIDSKIDLGTSITIFLNI